MNKIECSRIDLYEEIEALRSKLNRQKDLAGKEAMKISIQLDRLIIMAMKEKQDTGIRVKSKEYRIQE